MMRHFTLLALFALAACGPKPTLRIDDAWVRLGATATAPGAAYFTVHGGPADDRLLDVSSPAVIRAELHESMNNPGMSMMKPLVGGVPVPSKSQVKFMPGGLHAMLFNINPGIVPPRSLPLIFTFASGERIQVDAPVQRAGDAAPVS